MLDHVRPATALDRELLIPEISLLLEFISGRPNRTLGITSPTTLPGGCGTHEDALKKYLEISSKDHNPSGQITTDDVQFLLAMRDYLNWIAAPASGSTIAFSTLVTRKTPVARKGLGDAELAYPEWSLLARSLRRWMAFLQASAVVVTLVIAALAAYVYWGNYIISNVAELTAQINSIAREIERQESSSPVRVGDKIRHYCSGVTLVEDPSAALSYPKRMIEVYETATQFHICARLSDVVAKLGNAYSDLGQWSRPFGAMADAAFGQSISITGVTAVGPPAPKRSVSDRAAGATLAVLNGYVIPVLMGFLGSTAYVLRLYLRNLGDRLLTPRDLRSYAIRIVLGTLSGLAISFFMHPGGPAQDAAGPAATVTLTAPALAFLAGYAVEVLFRLLDGMAEQVFASRA